MNLDPEGHVRAATAGANNASKMAQGENSSARSANSHNSVGGRGEVASEKMLEVRR